MRLNDDPYTPAEYYFADDANRQHLPPGAKLVLDLSETNYALFVDSTVNVKPRLLSHDSFFSGIFCQKLDTKMPNTPNVNIDIRDSIADSCMIKLIVRAEMDFPKPDMEVFFHVLIHRGEQEIFQQYMYGDIDAALTAGKRSFSSVLRPPIALKRGDRITLEEYTLGIQPEPLLFGPLNVDVFSLGKTK
jgi:hypothetical protein